jgi:hypothetical protein
MTFFTTFLEIVGIKKILVYLLISVISIGALTTAYYVWRHNVEQRALLNYNIEQLQQITNDQVEFINNQKIIAEQSAAAARALVERNEVLDRRMSSIDRHLNSMAGQDRPASEILKQTIERLRNGETQ